MTTTRQSYPLISITIAENGQPVFSVPPETEQFLQDLHTDVTPIAAVGPYRSGKSWMLSYLSKQPQAFTTSNGSQACTRGIHINTEPYTTTNLLFMDTEGLGATGSNIELDSKILACSILFAAKVYFFVCGKVDSNLLSSLQCAIGTANWLKDASNQQCFNYQKPQLVVVIKDLTLELQDDNGKPIKPTQYLHACLDKYSQNNPEFKPAIDSLFSDVTCLTMAIPCAKEDMKEMKNLSQAFRSDLTAVAQDAYNKTRVKAIAENTNLNGPILLQMAKGLCAALTQPGAPRLLSVWESALQQAAIERKHKLLTQVRDKMNQHFAKRPIASLFLSSITPDLLARWIRETLAKTPNQALKFEEIAQLLHAIVDDCKTVDELQLERAMQQIGSKASLAETTQWVSQFLPPLVKELLGPHLDTAAQLDANLEQLKQEISAKNETIEMFDAQLNSLSKHENASADLDANAAQDSEIAAAEASSLKQQLLQAQTHNEELLLVNTTFQTEFGAQLAMLTSSNEQLRTELEQKSKMMDKSEKEHQESLQALRDAQTAEKDLRTQLVEQQRRETNDTRKRKIDEIATQQMRDGQTKSKQTIDSLQQTIKNLQQQLETHISEEQRLRIALVQAQCKSMFPTQTQR